MPSSISNGGAGAPASAPSSPNGSQPSTPSSEPYSAVLQKVDLANYLRLMRDNDNSLQLTLADNKAQREQTLKVRAAQAAKAAADLSLPSPAGDPVSLPEPEMGDINVSSPKTENHYYPQPPAPAPSAPAAQGMSALQKAAIAAALASGLGGVGAGGLLGGYLLGNKPAPAPIVAPVSPTPAPAPGPGTTTSITKGIGSTIDLVPPKGRSPQP